MNKWFCSIILCLCVLLSGCSLIEENNKSDNAVWNFLLAGNKQFDDYCQMETLQKENIDDDGYYQDSEIDLAEQDDNEGKVHVSLANNKLLNIAYFYNKECTDEIVGNDCYLFPGSSIYYKDKSEGSQFQTYKLKGFQLAIFEGEQNIFKYDTVEDEVITIPNNYPFSEISIFPIGEYTSRILSFESNFKNEDGKLNPAPIIWKISLGEQEYYTKTEKNDNYPIDSHSEYHVEAQFDAHDYYLLDDEIEPKYEEVSEEEGIVTVRFPQYGSQSSKNKYRLVFGKKYPFMINSIESEGGIITILVDGEKITNVSSYRGYAELGSVITIQSTAEITNIVSMHSFTKKSPYEYEYTVCKESETFEFDPANYSWNHGKVEFYYPYDTRIQDKITLNIGDKIYVKGTPDPEYAFSLGNDKIELKYDSNFKYTLEHKMEFKHLDKIELVQPAEGGKIKYYNNGSEYAQRYLSYAEGVTILTADFIPDSRYKTNDISDNAECQVTKNGLEYQIRFKNNNGNYISVNEVFKHSESQKAELSVKLDESVGTEMKFYIYNGDNLVNTRQKSYIEHDFWEEKHRLGRDDGDLIDDDNNKIETVSGIKISVSDYSLLNKEALKVETTLKDNRDNTVERIEYMIVGNIGNANLFINTSAGNSLYYKSIIIKIQKVTGSKINNKLYNIENGKIEFFYISNKNKEPITDGDFIDDSRKICMSVRPNQNYQIYKKAFFSFMDDSPLESSEYEKTFDYSDLEEEYGDLKTEIVIRH